MDKVNAFDKKTLFTELIQGREVANQLRSQLDQVTSPETCEALIEKILSTYDKALGMLTWKAIKQETIGWAESGMLLRSPQLHSPSAASPLSGDSDGTSKDEKCNKNVFKKRKVSPRRSQQVEVFSKRGDDGVSLNDGYSWRKYGQKDILGASHPRAYYRCTHRNSRGCLATKQVQRTDEDPSVFEVIYKGKHSCNQTANSSSMMFSDRKEMSQPEKASSKAEEDKQMQPQQMLLNLGQGLKVDTEALNTEEEIFPSFSFSFTGSEFENQENHFFSDADMMDGCSPTFLSPTTSESNYFSSPCHVNSIGFGNILQSSQNDHFYMTSTPTSVISSPFGDLDFLVDQADFYPNFPPDSLAYLS